MSVKRKEFISRMAETGGITKKEAGRGFDLFIETIIDCLADNKKIMISGFGNFEMKTTKERKCRNPQGGDDCIIPEHNRVRFHASDTLVGKIEGK